MKQLKQITQFVTERKRQDVCSGCGKSIEDSEKECPTCGAFPHKAYHERAAAKTLGISKWLQNSPVMQPNQKLSEENLNDWVEVGTINALVNAGTRTYSLEGTVERPNLYFSATN